MPGTSWGRRRHDKIMMLADRHADSHVAALGPAGENWQHNAYAAIACSTVNQLQSRQCKPRFAGRGGMGSVMGSKNLLAVVAQAPDLKRGKLSAEVREANKEISRGEGSRNYRDAKKGNGAGGTWRNVAGLHPIGALPENNFWPQGDDSPSSLYRNSMEEPYLIKDESCFQCGIACHKNIYDVDETDGRRKAGKFYAKFDYEPLDLLTINLGIYGQQQALDIVELVDQLGFDSISLGVTHRVCHGLQPSTPGTARSGRPELRRLRRHLRRHPPGCGRRMPGYRHGRKASVGISG